MDRRVRRPRPSHGATRTVESPWRPSAAQRRAPGGAGPCPDASATAAGIGRAPSHSPGAAWACRSRPAFAPPVSWRSASAPPTSSSPSSSSCGALYNSHGNVVNGHGDRREPQAAGSTDSVDGGLGRGARGKLVAPACRGGAATRGELQWDDGAVAPEPARPAVPSVAGSPRAGRTRSPHVRPRGGLLLDLLPVPRGRGVPVGSGGRPRESALAPALAPRRRHRPHLGAEGYPASAQARVLRQAPQGTPAPGGARPLPGVLRAGSWPPAGARLPCGVPGRAAVSHGPADHGRDDPRAPPVHARAAGQRVHAGAREDARVRARDGRAPARAMAGQERGAIRADLLVSLGSARGVAARGGRPGAAPVARDGRRARDRAVYARCRVHDRARAGSAVRARVRRGRAGGDDALPDQRDAHRLRGRGLARTVVDPRVRGKEDRLVRSVLRRLVFPCRGSGPADRRADDHAPGRPVVTGRYNLDTLRNSCRRSCTAVPPSARRNARNSAPIGRRWQRQRRDERGSRTDRGAAPYRWYTTPHG